METLPTIDTTTYAMSTMSDTVLGPVEFNTHVKRKKERVRLFADQH